MDLTHYVRAVAQGGPRFDLDGREAGRVTDDERAHARKALGWPRPSEKSQAAHQAAPQVAAIAPTVLKAMSPLSWTSALGPSFGTKENS